MPSRHKRALITTGILAIVLLPLLGYLWWVRAQDVSADLKPLGPIPQFTYVLDDGSTVFTHSDAMLRITVLLQLKNCQSPCAEYAQTMTDLVAWSEDALRPKNAEETPPQPISFLVMQRPPHVMPAIPAGWRPLTLGADENFLAPASLTESARDQFVVIDTNGVFRAALPADDPKAPEKLQHLLTKLTSSQFLFHYLAKQTLMWEKVRGRK